MFAFTDFLSDASTAWNTAWKVQASIWPVGTGYKGNGGVAQDIGENTGALVRLKSLMN